MTLKGNQRAYKMIGRKLKEGCEIGLIVCELANRFGIAEQRAVEMIHTWQEADEIGLEELEAASDFLDRITNSKPMEA